MEISKKCKFGTVTRRTYNKRVRDFAKRSTEAFKALTSFVDRHGPKGKAAKGKYMDELTAIIDEYVDLNCAMRDWGCDRKVDLAEFFCDVGNESFPLLPAAEG